MSLSIDIPPGLSEMLQDFTVAVLKEYPKDLVVFAAEYFNKLNEDKDKKELLEDLGRQVVNRAGAAASSIKRGGGSPDGQNETPPSDESDEEMEEPPPRNSMNRRQSVAAESFDPEKDDDDDETNRVVYPKTDEQRTRLNHAIQDILLFRCLDEEQISEVIDAMFEKKIEPGTKVITQGEDGDNFYVIESGTYDTHVEINGIDKLVYNYDNKGYFGELALLYNCPRAATIIASSPGVVWGMDRITFRRIVLKRAFLKRQMFETLLESVPILKELSPYERNNVADALVTRAYEDGQVIIKQGDPGKNMFFVEEGIISIMRKNENEEKEINRLQKGDYFGELALITHQPRVASAVAVGKAKVAVLDVASFERLLGPCLDVMGRNIDSYRKQLKDMFGSDKDIPDLRNSK